MFRALLLALVFSGCCSAAVPEGLHVSYASSDGSDLWVTWAVVGDASPPVAPRCVYGKENKVSLATTATYNDSCTGRPTCTAWGGRLHTARLSSVLGKDVEYRCGDEGTGWSAPRVIRSNAESPLVFAMTADIGASDAARKVRDDMVKGVRAFDFVLMVGDIAYTDGNQSVWDDFATLWEPVSGAVPTLLSPGNHDGDWVFGNNYNPPASTWVGGGESGKGYSLRYPGPGPRVAYVSPHKHVGGMTSTSYWWSVSYKTATVIATSGVHAFEPGSEQYKWLVGALEAAQKDRSARPWLIVTNHFPMYCTIDDCFCGNYTRAAREQLCEPGRDGKYLPGILEINAPRIRDALEALLLKYKVDVFLSGHEHAYERTTPVADLHVTHKNRNYGKGAVYTNPGAPIHVMAGTGGGGPDTKWRRKEDYQWASVRSDTADDDTSPFGWTRFTATRTSLAMEYRNINIHDAVSVVDSFVIEKTE